MSSILGVIELVRRAFVEEKQTSAPGGHLVGFVPGIRTNADWVDRLGASADWLAEGFEFRKLSTVKPMSSISLLTRYRVLHLQNDIRRQIQLMIDERGSRKISLVCHSMGSALVADILREEINLIFDNIIFLGSVVHKKHALSIRSKCVKFYNFRGTRDQWPLLAALLRPSHYGPTGNYGFSNASCSDLTLDTDHQGCTDGRYFQEFVLPLLRGLRFDPPEHVPSYFDENLFRYSKNVYYPFIFILTFTVFFSAYKRNVLSLIILLITLLIFTLGVPSFYALGRKMKPRL